MYTLFALVVTATAAAVVVARPPGPVATTAVFDDDSPRLGLETPTRKYLREYLLPRYLWPHYVGYEDNGILRPQLSASDWLNKEIDRLSQIQDRSDFPYNMPEESRRMSRNAFMKRLLGLEMRNPIQPHFGKKQGLTSWSQMSESHLHHYSHELKPSTKSVHDKTKKSEFALSPLDDGYFEFIEPESSSANVIPEGMHEGGDHPNMIELEPPREIRQNPNRNKNLIAGNLERLNIGLVQDGIFVTEKPRHIRTEAIEYDEGNSFYGVAVMAAIGAAVVMTLLGFGIGWYTLSKRAKAAADVDYPAYGVTGPTIDTSGDRKLAHSAHMYHYQHQKQQIIAMERNGLEQRNGSVSDPDSEDENEEGDYTVYECPGFATTGDMEVKNPLFNEEPTPATPGKCEVVKPQPKD